MKKQIIELANTIIKRNCELLNIAPPAFYILKPEKFPTPTTQAASASDGSEIIYNESYIQYHENNKLQLWICISHECRHIWQARNHEWNNEFMSYKSSDIIDQKKYNAQLPEIDAWAWAAYFMNKQFGINLEFNKIFDSKTCKMIDIQLDNISSIK